MVDVRFSKFMVTILRHEAMNRGISVSPEGYVDVDDILGLPEASRYSLADVEKMVNNDAKGRYKMRTYRGKKEIKATQGHSMTLGSPELVPINHYTEARTVLHGTRSRNWDSIRSQGLSRKGRTHIHFAPGEVNTKSGFPVYCDMAVEINLRLALRDGLKFYKSENEVILSPGNSDGFIPPKYFQRAYNIHTRKEIPLS